MSSSLRAGPELFPKDHESVPLAEIFAHLGDPQRRPRVPLPQLGLEDVRVARVHLQHDESPLPKVPRRKFEDGDDDGEAVRAAVQGPQVFVSGMKMALALNLGWPTIDIMCKAGQPQERSSPEENT